MIPATMDLVLPVPGGILPVERLRLMAECAMGAAQGVLVPGPRQEIIIPLVNPAASMAGQFLREVEGVSSSNIVSSAPSVDTCDGLYWLNHEVLEELAANILEPPCTLSLVDPRQSLVPRFASRLNFLAEPEPGMWRPWVCRHEGAPVRLPFQLQSEEIPSFLVAGSGILSDEAMSLANLARGLETTGFGSPEHRADVKLIAPSASHHVDGIHRAVDGSWWLGLFNCDRPFDSKLLVDVALQAREQGIGSVYVTTRRSLVVKGIRENAIPQWRRLLARHGAASCHGEREHGWLMGNRGDKAVRLRAEIIERLDKAGSTLAGVPVAIGEGGNCPRAGIEIHMVQPGGIRRMLQGSERFSLHVRPHLDPDSGPLLLVAEGLRQADAARAVVEQIEKHLGRRDSQMAPVAAVSSATEALAALQCRECLSHFDQKMHGDFSALPDTWLCEVCDAPKSAYFRAGKTPSGSLAGIQAG